MDFAVDIFGWYVYMFLLGGYLRRIIDDIKVPAKKLICFSAISYGMILLSELVIDYIGAHFIWSILKYAEHFRKINSFFIVFSVVTLVAGAAKLKPEYNRFVQTVASTTLGVFLIHDNKAMIPLLWRRLLRCYEFTSSKYLILHASVPALRSLPPACCLTCSVRRQWASWRTDFLAAGLKRSTKRSTPIYPDNQPLSTT